MSVSGIIDTNRIDNESARNIIINSSQINVDGIPDLPPIGYFNLSGGNNDSINFNSYDKLKTNLTDSCSNINTKNGLFKNIPTNCTNSSGTKINCNIPDKIPVIDAPYYLAMNGVLNKNTINSNNPNTDSANLTNQIQYLACQLVKARNRVYNPSDFIEQTSGSISEVFNKFGPTLRIPLIILFIVTTYYLISGFFSSFDVTANVINIIQKNSSSYISYWVGLLFGISIPLILISIGYNSLTKTNLNDLQKNEITNNSHGIINNISDSDINIDYTTLTLFIILIYGFVGVLFTIKKSSFNNYIYTAFITVVLLIIAMLLYILYAYIPFYNSANQSYMFQVSNRPLRVFTDEGPSNNEDISTIRSNQKQDSLTRSIYLATGIGIFIMSILYFKFSKSFKLSNNESFFPTLLKSFSNGFLGSFSILIIPILWVLNFVIGLQYFYIYPLFLISFRFIRYFGTMILYLSTKNSSKANFSDDLIKELDNIKDYTPSWGLLGVQELKTFLQMFGYENLFSKSFIDENNSSHNISDNKFVSSGFLPHFIIEKNSGGMVLSVIITILTVIFSMTILFGVLKI